MKSQLVSSLYVLVLLSILVLNPMQNQDYGFQNNEASSEYNNLFNEKLHQVQSTLQDQQQLFQPLQIDELSSGLLPNKASSMAGSSTYLTSTSISDGSHSMSDVTILNANSTHAIFKDADPWGTLAIEEALNNLGIIYDIYNSSNMGSINLSAYERVVIASDQTANFYQALYGNLSWFETYTSNGGFLQIHAADSGWNGGYFVNGQLPFGINVFNQYGEYVKIINNNSIIPYYPNYVELDQWGSSYHGYLANISDASVILATNDVNESPILIEGNFGSGQFMISTQTLEFAYVNHGATFLVNTFITKPGFGVFLDAEPWGSTSITEILNSFGLEYTILRSSDMGIVDLSQYDRVIIASDQPQAFYDAFNGNISWFEGYVNNGGLLNVHAADQGWNSGSVVNGTLPFGISYTSNSSDIVHVQQGNSILLHLPNEIADGELDNWGSSYHGYLKNTNNTNIVLTTNNNEPILVYGMNGSGQFLISTQTLEFAMMNNNSRILENLMIVNPMNSFTIKTPNFYFDYSIISKQTAIEIDWGLNYDYATENLFEAFVAFYYNETNGSRILYSESYYQDYMFGSGFISNSLIFDVPFETLWEIEISVYIDNELFTFLVTEVDFLYNLYEIYHTWNSGLNDMNALWEIAYDLKKETFFEVYINIYEITTEGEWVYYNSYSINYFLNGNGLLSDSFTFNIPYDAEWYFDVSYYADYEFYSYDSFSVIFDNNYLNFDFTYNGTMTMVDLFSTLDYKLSSSSVLVIIDIYHDNNGSLTFYDSVEYDLILYGEGTYSDNLSFHAPFSSIWTFNATVYLNNKEFMNYSKELVLVNSGDLELFITNNGNLNITEGSTGNSIVWTVNSDNRYLATFQEFYSGHYFVTVDTLTLSNSGVWKLKDEIAISLDGLTAGDYQLTITIEDIFGNILTNTVSVRVIDPNVTTDPVDTTTTIITTTENQETSDSNTTSDGGPITPPLPVNPLFGFEFIYSVISLLAIIGIVRISKRK
jgi:hypothetical protein